MLGPDRYWWSRRLETMPSSPSLQACANICGVGVQQPRLTDQIEAHVRQRDVLFEDRAVAAPFGIALTENQRGIREAQHVLTDVEA